MTKNPTPPITVRENSPWGIVPPPELLELFEPYGPEATLEVLRIWRDEHRADFIYSTLALLIAGFLGFGLIGG